MRMNIGKVLKPSDADADPALDAAASQPDSSPEADASTTPESIGTATMKPDGTLAFHKDIYGRDAAIAVALR